MKRAARKYLVIGLLSVIIIGGLKTYYDVRSVPSLYRQAMQVGQYARLTDRHGHPLWIDYQTQWNHHDQLKLHQFPSFLREALILSEDKNFYHHKGIDWPAKAMAAWQNVKARRVMRGASSLSEQVVHLLTNRPRTWWTKWLELIEALWLEYHFSKNDILEFYLNQVPFAANRRGFHQAARHYFNRDLSLLTHQEILSLIILIKAPSGYDLRKTTSHVKARLLNFRKRLLQESLLTVEDSQKIEQQTLQLEAPSQHTDASHFIISLKKLYGTELSLQKSAFLRTTLDSGLQGYVQRVLDHRIKALKARQVHNGAVLIMDHTNGEILAWAVAGSSLKVPTPSARVDAVLAMRQPGSTLKPFVYAAALQKGWQANTLIQDAPLVGAVGTGMHKFKNYSNMYYGSVTLREALANSLNVPAVKTIQFVGVEPFLTVLQQLGFKGFNRGAEVYEEGLALGNGEVSLLELVQAYATLANKGKTRCVKLFYSQNDEPKSVDVFPEAVASLIGDILSDPWARRLEFGASSVMTLPVQTAIKTGTSTDYRDAWIVGYNHKYVVGIWMGNLNNKPMDGVTGSTGGALLLRSIFSYLNHASQGQKLYQSPQLIQREVLIKKDNHQEAAWQTEFFLPSQNSQVPGIPNIKIMKPTPLLRIAIDPRVPLHLQKFECQLTEKGQADTVEWKIDGQEGVLTNKPTYLWPLRKGAHTLQAHLYQNGERIHQTPVVTFYVK